MNINFSDLKLENAKVILSDALENVTRNGDIFVVWADHCDGYVAHSTANIDVYNSYFDASNKINEYECLIYDSVDVYVVRKTYSPLTDTRFECVHIKTKIFDDPCYSSLAACSAYNFSIMEVSRRLIDINAVVHIH